MQTIMTAWWRLVRFGFRLLYNELAFTYDIVSKMVSLGAWRCWQRTAMRHIDRPRADTVLLELAHGTGDLQLDLKWAGYRVIGYDLSAAMGRIAYAKLKQHGESPFLARGMAQSLPFPHEQFDAIISTFPTDFIFRGDTLSEVHRVLKPDGRLVIVPNGVLLGGGGIRDFIEWLYRITGQREANTQVMNSVRAFFEAHGFEMQTYQEECFHNSVAQVIVACKKT